MTRDEIIAKVRETAPALRAEGVTKLVAPFSLLSLSGVGLMVEDATGLTTQVTLRRSLDERMAERMADDMIEVF